MAIQYLNKEDKELWQLVKEEDNTGAFAEIHRRYSPKLFSLAVRKLGDSDLAEDLIQELFVAFWIHRQTIQIERAFNSYLFSSLKNRIISHLRHQLTQKSVYLDDLESEVLFSHSANLVLEWIQASELQEIYLQELKSLPEKSRQVFELSRSGLANKEIAEVLDLAEKTIEFHISKCIRMLRQKLKYIVSIALLLLT